MRIRGLTDLALAAKNYIKSLYGSDGPQYRQIAAWNLFRLSDCYKQAFPVSNSST